MSDLAQRLRAVVSGFKSEAINGVICTPPSRQVGTDAMPDYIHDWNAEPSRTWCVRRKSRWQELFIIADELERTEPAASEADADPRI